MTRSLIYTNRSLNIYTANWNISDYTLINCRTKQNFIYLFQIPTMRLLLFCLLTLSFVVARGRESDTAWHNKGDTAAKVGKYKEAISYYTKAIESNPNVATIYSKRGTAYLNLYEYKNAINDFQMAVNLNPFEQIYKINLRLAIAECATYNNPKKTPSHKRFDNYYAPWHQTIKDSTHQTISDIGGYISAGIGGGSAYGISGVSALLSASLAAKSLLITLTWCGASVPGEKQANTSYYTASYFGFLIGESVRFKHVMLSLSAGIAISTVSVYGPSFLNPNNTICDLEGVVSFPIEFKYFFCARNGIGIGIHSSKCLVSPSQFSPFYFGICIVGGYWNKPNKASSNK
ncbi:MAG TPA: tetratricopeptide repeat protein [Bacteroidia bacterium]